MRPSERSRLCNCGLCVLTWFWYAHHGAQDPIRLAYADDAINVAIHVRRGDVAKNPGLRDRYTNDTTYVTILRTLATLVDSHPLVGQTMRGRVHVHVFSQGEKV